MFSFNLFLPLILYLINILRFSGSSGLLSGLAGTEARVGQACEGEWRGGGKEAACATPSDEIQILLSFQLNLPHCLALISSIIMAIIIPRQHNIFAKNYRSQGWFSSDGIPTYATGNERVS